jgi:hypothetical protein
VALAQAVSTLAGNPALRQRLGEAGRLAAAARQEFAQAALRIYEAAVPAFGRRQHVLANTEA